MRYFERTYITRRVNGQATHGKFKIADWNCRAAALQGLPRTNNDIEAWHRTFNERFPVSNMLLSQFIIRLKDEEEKTRKFVVT